MTLMKDGRSLVEAGFSNAVEWYRLRYDFAKDGGAVGVLDILTAGEPLILVAAFASVKTTATSGGSAVVTWGVTANDAQFMGDVQGAVANLTAGTVIFPQTVGVSDPLPYLLPTASKVIMTIATAALTAGVIEFVLGVMKP